MSIFVVGLEEDGDKYISKRFMSVNAAKEHARELLEEDGRRFIWLELAETSAVLRDISADKSEYVHSGPEYVRKDELNGAIGNGHLPQLGHGS